jgi:hypothetical protein
MKGEQKSTFGAPRRFDDPRILEFKPRLRSSTRKHAPIVDPLQQFEIEDDRLRMQQNVAAFIVLVLILAAGLWLFHELRTSARALICVEVGYENCPTTRRQQSWGH